MDALGFKIETPAHDLTTPRGRLLYLRDVVVPGIPLAKLDMRTWDCGTHACLMGWSARRGLLSQDQLQETHEQMKLFGINHKQWSHLAHPHSYGSSFNAGHPVAPTHAELRAHIDDVLEGRVR